MEIDFIILFGGIGLSEILVIAGIAILLFGATQIPKVARSLGEGLKEFKKAIKDTKNEEDSDSDTYNKKETKKASKKIK